MRRVLKRAAILIMTFALLLQVPVSARAAAAFPDVKSTDWYYDNVTMLVQLEMVNGKDDGLFHPDDNITRGEFIKLAMIAGDHLYSTTTSKGVHWAENYWNALNEAGVLEVVETSSDGTGFENSKQTTYPIIPLKASELDKPISRYEMAFIINRILYLVYYENQMTLADAKDSYANHISDYNTMSPAYRSIVEQVYSKGILTGYGDSSFQGGNALTRAEATTVILRLLSSKYRVKQSWAVEKEVVIDTSFTSFAIQYRNMSNADRHIALFGDPNKAYFTSYDNTGNHIVSVAVKTWDINSSGTKYTRIWSLQVNAVVSREVKAIFDYIYNDPEKFPIHVLGGFRTSDTLRHSWGCAIDINPTENYYINYKTGQTVGSFCYKNGSSPYTITPNSSVVKAFAMYGWGWGGQGWSTAADYMHFSILASGG